MNLESGQILQLEKRETLRKESKEFFYSETLKKHVAYEPLKIDDRAVRAASELGIDLSWDDEARLKDISFIDTIKLVRHLGGSLLSPSEYWKVLADAKSSGDEQMIKKLTSDQATEWLDAVFQRDESGKVWMIEHPEVVEDDHGTDFRGERIPIDVPEGRPGWFNPEGNINSNTGIPLNVEVDRGKGTQAWSATNWKYWSVFKTNEFVAPIRGYVTSSGTPSLDLDIPVGAKQPVLMMRECRKELLAPTINPELLDRAHQLIESYQKTLVDQPATQNPTEHRTFYNQRQELFDFLSIHGKEFVGSKDSEAIKVKGKIIDMLGEIRINALANNDLDTQQAVKQLANELFPVDEEKTGYQAFESFIENAKEELRRAIEEKKKIVFVMGHKNPDTDTAISSTAEAFRNNLLDQDAAYIPVIQSLRIPDEIRRLIGDRLADSLILTDDPDYQTALNSGQARWILVDQNVSEVQRFAISIVDHHILSEKAKKIDIPVTWEMAGSTAALISQKLLGLGIELDPELARILYGATLMDTENRSDKKMTFKDKMLMDELKKISKVEDDNELYQDLMSFLLNTDDAERLFQRDYKQDWGIFGFSVAKVKGAFDKEGEPIKEDLLSRLVELAKANNNEKNFPLTIVKVVDYLEDNKTVNLERIYLIFNKFILPEFRKVMFNFIEKIIDNEFQGRAKIAKYEDSIDFSGVGGQLSRKVTAPFLEPVVNAFNEYYHSEAADTNVGREFAKVNQEFQRAADELGIKLSQDNEGRINNITLYEARQILDKLGYSMMSLSEYWKVLKEAEDSRDEQMLVHLRSPGFVELLDTIIINGEYIIDHPTITKTERGYQYSGERRKAQISMALPGLIHPDDIDLETGFPMTVHDPREYGNKALWRYWSPDAPVCIATRGHIFLLNQPSFDTKIHPDDALPNLGIRPTCKAVKPPEVEIVTDNQGVRAVIKKG